ncbi:hypothetical protein AAC387_Pa09g0541 [Persea americana]
MVFLPATTPFTSSAIQETRSRKQDRVYENFWERAGSSTLVGLLRRRGFLKKDQVSWHLRPSSIVPERAVLGSPPKRSTNLLKPVQSHLSRNRVWATLVTVHILILIRWI